MSPPLHDRKKRIAAAFWVCISSCGLTALLLAAVYALRGIWPFGTDNVAYMDAAQFYLPGYYSLWDRLHAGLSSGAWEELLYPYNWPIFFVARDHVLEAMSLYVGIRILIIAAITSIVLCRRFPRISGLWKTLFTLLYTFSGFVLQYYSNFSWLAVAAVFPLMLLGLESLLRDGKYVLYTVMYVYFLRLDIYYTYMATIYILLFSLGYCLIVMPREKRGDRVFRLGLSTVAALGICSYRWTRRAVSLAGSARFQDNLDTGIQTGMTTWNIPNIRHTFLMLMGMALIAALFLRALRRQRTASGPEKAARGQAIRFFCYMLGVFALPMIFTNIDTAWHFGQYNFFPMRYGYMLPATLIAGGCLALEDEAAHPAAPALAAPGRRAWLPWAGLGLAGAGILLLVPRLALLNREYGACFLNLLGSGCVRYLLLYAFCGVLFTAVYFLLLRTDRRWSVWAVGAVVLFQLGANAWGHIAPNDDHTATHEYDPAYIETSEQLFSYFSQREAPLISRVKNVDNSLNAGYPAIAGVNALSSISSGTSAGRLRIFQDLGYSTNYFRILDTGGTVFSDMLFRIDQVLSAAPLDEDLYQPGDTVAGIQIGSVRYPGVLGLMYDEDALADYFDLETIPDRLNALYGAFTDGAGPLAEALAPEMEVSGDGLRTYVLTCRLEAPAFLYFALDGIAVNIRANGQPVAVPSYLNPSNTVYPVSFNNNLLCLGLFPAGEAEVRFSSAMELTEKDLTLMSLDKAALDGFQNTANADRDMVLEKTPDGYAITVTADRAGRRMFLPISPGGRSCTVNGQPAALSYFIGIMTSIPLQEGENTILLFPDAGQGSWFTSDRLLPASCLALALLWLILRRVFPRLRTLVLPKVFYTASLAAFFAVTAAVVGFVYIAPLWKLVTNGQIIWF